VNHFAISGFVFFRLKVAAEKYYVRVKIRKAGFFVMLNLIIGCNWQ
jgi:hypothetical protein